VVWQPVCCPGTLCTGTPRTWGPLSLLLGGFLSSRTGNFCSSALSTCRPVCRVPGKFQNVSVEEDPFPVEPLPTVLPLHQPTMLSLGLLSILSGVKLLLRSSPPLLLLGIFSCSCSSQSMLARGCSLGAGLVCVRLGLRHKPLWHGRFPPTSWSGFMQVEGDVMSVSSLLAPELFHWPWVLKAVFPDLCSSFRSLYF